MGYKIKDFKTIDDFNLKGEKILLRVDLNSEIINKKISINERIKEHAKTIDELKKKKARVVVLAHQGRPGDKDFTTLKKHSELINKITKIKFVDDIIGKKAVNNIKNLKDGEALLLDNVRAVPDEFSSDYKDNSLIKVLTPLFDFYFNDALSVSHRTQTSVTGFPKFLKSGVGRVLEKELVNLEKINLKECLFILAGSKPKDNISLIDYKKIITGGLFGFLCNRAEGYNLGKYNKNIEKYKELIPKIKERIKKSGINNPIDFAYELKGKRKEGKLSDLPINHNLYDIGTETINLYKKEIKKAKSIYLKGTIGYSEKEIFNKGTREIFKAIADSKAFSVIGGGHSSAALERLKINKSKIGYISLSGGALVHYLAGEKLPGLDVLKIKKR